MGIYMSHLSWYWDVCKDILLLWYMIYIKDFYMYVKMTMIFWYRLHNVFMGFDKNYIVENMLKTSKSIGYLLNMVKLNG